MAQKFWNDHPTSLKDVVLTGLTGLITLGCIVTDAAWAQFVNSQSVNSQSVNSQSVNSQVHANPEMHQGQLTVTLTAVDASESVSVPESVRVPDQ